MRRCWDLHIRGPLFKSVFKKGTDDSAPSSAPMISRGGGLVHSAVWTGIVFAALAALSASTDPLADLKTGAAAIEQKKYPAAIAALDPLAKQLPKIADYPAFFLASAKFEMQDYAGAARALDLVFNMTPPSPLAAQAALLDAHALEKSGDPKAALAVLRGNYASLPQPPGDVAMAEALEQTGDPAGAAAYHQRVYYLFPMSPEAPQSEAELVRLRAGLGEKYPPPAPHAMLGRALKLLDAKQYAKARAELDALLPELTGADKDLARVRMAVADYQARETPRAHTALASMEVSTPEADAERLHYLLLCAQRLKNQDEVDAVLDKLARLYPHSKWRLESLIAAANHSLVENRMQAYEPLFRACYESFPHDPKAAECHWKVAWGHYLRRQEDSAEMLRAHLRLFPGSDYAAGALYFLGRLSDAASARVYYEEIVREYPNYYYTVVARDRLKELGNVAPSAKANEFLRGIAFPTRARTLNFEPDPASRARMERARLLSAAGLDEWAVAELRFGAAHEDQPQVLAVALAALTSKTAGPDQAMRYIKHFAGNYLFMPLDSAPAEFWKYAFPLPYRAELDRYAKQQGLDPFLVAALIRQESEFNPKAVSRANARGLTQILPVTGRELSRKLKMRSYATSSLFVPAVNLQLGTFYLKSIVDNLGGRWEAALAAYNAGPTRAKAWSSWGEFREPAEFIETVPFSETRNYIQTVLRNADTYRRIYGAAPK